MSQLYPETLKYTKKANATRIYFLLGIFVFVMILIFKIFFEEEIRELILGNIYEQRAKDTQVEPGINKEKKEVYNIGKNIYTYDEAKRLCKQLDSSLATHEQVVNAYKNGAEWCNYGWTQGQNALFPVQKNTWEEIQTRPEPYRYECGHDYGVNGGFFENNNLKFGANCYGIKPKGNISKNYELTSYDTSQDSNGKTLTQDEIDKLGIIPFNENKWSKYS
tara:strand:+ start:436 stop:1095 length:660 start_codon:yes stop_codon:yes gene_type:complete